MTLQCVLTQLTTVAHMSCEKVCIDTSQRVTLQERYSNIYLPEERKQLQEGRNVFHSSYAITRVE